MEASIPPVVPRSLELRHGREKALRVLYAADVSGIHLPGLAFEACSAHFFAEEALSDELDAEVSARSLVIAQAWVSLILQEKATLDATIGRSSKRWKVSRMQPIERNILRIGVFEAVKVDDIPARDTIYDCVELGKRFGSSSSAGFVNGILDQICRDNDISL
jgi:N utilization substance protein B